MKISPLTQILLAIILSISLASCGFAAEEWWPEGKKTDKFTSPILLDSTPINRDTSPNISYANIVKKVTPSVVSVIPMRSRPKREIIQHPFLDDPFFRRFFGPEFFGNPEENVRPRRNPNRSTPAPENNRSRPEPSGIGSGVVITSDGYIVTNNHVIDEADEVKISFDGLKEGKREIIAKIIGTDKRTDIAILKVDMKDLTPIVVGDSDQIEVGDIVLAVGNPFSFTQTVTSGIVSALGRNATGNKALDSLFTDFIQTDAPINQGNSGGALVDIQGRLIGINTLIFTSSGGNIGIGFAIPVNTVRNITEQLITKGKISRGYIGVSIQDISDDLAEAYKIKNRDGAIVSEVMEDSPAAAAGIQHGDIIIEFNGRPVDNSSTLRRLVANTPAGTPSTIKVLRDNKSLTLNITPKELPANLGGSDSSKSTDQSEQGDTTDQSPLSGVELGDITATLRERFNIPEKMTGVVILSITPESPSAEAGLAVGDVIRDIGSRPVKNIKEANKLLKENKDKRHVLRVWSRETRGTRFIVVDEN
jgi:serine protease Do